MTKRRIFTSMPHPRSLVLLFSALLGLTMSASPASAMHTVPTRTAMRAVPLQAIPRTVRFAGQVTTVSGRINNPTGFTLQVRDRLVDIRIVPRTNFVARSAEAQVEDFGQYSFALVTASKSNGEWTASRVEFDVV